MVNAGEWFAGNPCEHLAGLALDRYHRRDREACGIRAINARGHYPVTGLDLGVWRYEAQFWQSAATRAVHDAAHAAAFHSYGYRMVRVGDQRHLVHIGKHA